MDPWPCVVLSCSEYRDFWVANDIERMWQHVWPGRSIVAGVHCLSNLLRQPKSDWAEQSCVVLQRVQGLPGGQRRGAAGGGPHDRPGPRQPAAASAGVPRRVPRRPRRSAAWR